MLKRDVKNLEMIKRKVKGTRRTIGTALNRTLKEVKFASRI